MLGQFPLFLKYKQVGTKIWLRSALASVNEQYDHLNVKAADFGRAALEDKWEPIPLDRKDPTLKEATKAVDAVIEAVEADNGYAVHAPSEREYVLSRLKAVSETLKQKAQIHWMDVKTFALEPLGRLIKRFGPAAVGTVAVVARKAIFEWLKANYSKALDWFM
jgi:hypothetical protein